ncbi:MAG: guanylate kinase [Bacteroides sp.]|nr:guanylate kinase [Eubacterium sp.]MCM1417952.1 guanylate kinase [Roseburia sp.]MCM1461801.1 guanylate kinase [Bacteroides sp.]
MDQKDHGILIVVSAPAGCGKDTILERALEKNKNLYYSVSATSRAIRPNETDGVSYYFKTRAEFEAMIAEGGLLEYTEYCGNYYGTPKKAVEETLAAGKDVILKIEVEGAMNIKRIFPDCVMIFILPPSFEELSRRLHKRGTEDEETILRRIETAKNELTYAEHYDYLIVNGELSAAVDEFLTVVSAEKARTARRKPIVDGLLGR